MFYDRWLQLMNNLGLEANKETYEKLLSAYDEKHRFYHNKSHIDAVLKSLDKASALTENKNEIELSLWFHDAIYQPFSSTNEADSAHWVRQFLEDNSVPSEVRNKIYNLVMATAHTALLKDSDEKLIVDVDLAILGCSEDVYSLFETNIRKEYKKVPMLLYRRKRKEILNSFLNRDRIYFHDYFHDRLEKQARMNIKNAVRKL